MTGASNPGAWGGRPDLKRSAVATVSAAVSGNVRAVPSATLYLDSEDGRPSFGNAYCVAFDTEDTAELEARSGLPVATLRLIGGALFPCVERGHKRTAERPYVTPVAKHCLVDALEAIRPGADLAALPGHYVVALLRELHEPKASPDDASAATLEAARQRVAQLHADELDGRAPDAGAWSAVRREAVAATDAAATPVGRKVAQFVETVAWPIGTMAEELPGLVERLHYDLGIAEQQARHSPEIKAVKQRVGQAYESIHKAAQSESSVTDEWYKARMAEHPDIQAHEASECQDQLIAVACAVCDQHGPRAYRLLIDALKQL